MISKQEPFELTHTITDTTTEKEYYEYIHKEQKRLKKERNIKNNKNKWFKGNDWKKFK